MKQLGVLFTLMVIVNLVNNGQALRCLPCDPDIVCEELPKDEDCYPAFEVCECCPQCAGLEGDFCDNFSVRCHPDLVCVNEKGEEMVTVPWYEFDFKGTCEESEYEYDEYYD